MKDVQPTLNIMHRHLMYLKFPYHSVSVIHRKQDLGFHVIFSESVRDKVDEKLKNYMKAYGFEHSFVNTDQDEKK